MESHDIPSSSSPLNLSLQAQPTMLFAKFISAAVALAGFSGIATACPGIDHAQGLAPRHVDHSIQPSGGDSLLRELQWGSLQVVATTDIHGWYQGASCKRRISAADHLVITVY